MQDPNTVDYIHVIVLPVFVALVEMAFKRNALFFSLII